MALVAVVVLGAAPVALVEVGLTIDGPDNDKRFVGVLTLAGVMVTALVSLIGILAGRQSDRRAAHRHEAEESRLRLDAAMRAGELLSKTTDHASPAAVASGLLALTRLDRADLAVALLVDLWDCGQQGAWAAPGGSPPARVSNETAILVLDAALTCDDSHAQLVAAGLLCRNAFRLDICGPLNWPPSIDGAWDRHFGPKTKLLLVDALVQHALHSKEREAALRSLAVRLYAISRADPDKHVRGCIGQLLAVVVPKIRKLENGGTIMQGSLEVTKRQLERAVRRAHDNPDRLLGEMTQERAASLDDWARKCSLAKPDASPGALACAPILPAAEALTEG